MTPRGIRIGFRLAIGFSLVIGLSLLLGFLAIYQGFALSRLTEDMYDHPLTVSNATRDIRNDIKDIQQSLKDAIISRDGETLVEIARRIDLLERHTYECFDLIQERFLGNPQDVIDARQAFAGWKTIRDPIFPLATAGQIQPAADLALGRSDGQAQLIDNKIRIMADFARTKAESFYQSTRQIRNTFHGYMLITVICVLLVSVWIGYYMTRSITGPINSIIRTIKTITAGNLDQRIEITGNDELTHLSQSFNTMTHDLKLSTTSIESLNDEIRQHLQTQEQRNALIKELQSKNEELERFTYTVSHDLKAPLVTIKGFVNILKDDLTKNQPDQIETDMRYIDNAADKMYQLLEELLKLSRIGRMTNPPEIVNLNRLVNGLAQLMQLTLNEKHILLAIQPDMPPVYADPVRIHEVFQNLLDNSIKYMGPQPEPRIEITAHLNPDHWIECQVRDNGLGIDPKYQRRIFNLFEQLDKTKGGSGVGLTIVKRIVEFHGGTITVESTGPGCGTTMRFTLPGIPPSNPAPPA